MATRGPINATGALSSAAAGTAVELPGGDYGVSISGTFVGTVVVERSHDDGTTWVPVAYPWIATLVSVTAPAALTLREPSRGTQVRVRCSAYTSGTINWRITAKPSA